jgi:hypothetical protein
VSTIIRASQDKDEEFLGTSRSNVRAVCNAAIAATLAAMVSSVARAGQILALTENRYTLVQP